MQLNICLNVPTCIDRSSYELLPKVKKSNVIHVEAVIKSDLKKSKTEIPLKEIMNQLSWKEPHLKMLQWFATMMGQKLPQLNQNFINHY